MQVMQAEHPPDGGDEVPLQRDRTNMNLQNYKTVKLNNCTTR